MACVTLKPRVPSILSRFSWLERFVRSTKSRMAWWRFSFSLYTNYVYLYRNEPKSSPHASRGSTKFQISNPKQIQNLKSKTLNPGTRAKRPPTARLHDCTKHAHSACLGNAAKGLVEGVALGGGKTGFFDHGEEVLSSGGIVGACRAHDIFFNHDAAHIVGSKVKRYLGNR